jgi:oxygen-dependent protoporphyrinogen oxidase
VKKVLIAGAGISGLSVAYYLRRLRPDLSITLLDSRERLGGVITTLAKSGFVIEGGPDSFITLKPWGMQLCRDLRIEDRLFSTDPANRKVYILSRGRLEPLPPGVMLTAPTRVLPLLKSRLFTWRGKIRMGMDLFLPRGPEIEDESLGAFVRRRLGQEAVDKIAEPILGGIFLAEADQLSLRSTFPRFIEMEKDHRSLILAMRRQAKPAGGAGGAAASPFRTLPGGMGELVEALRAALPKVEFRTGVRVERIESPRRVVTTRGVMEPDAVVLAVPPPDCASILRGLLPEIADRVSCIPTLTTATVSLGYREPKTTVPLDATGFVIARGENRRILACTWTSRKFAKRAPAGHLLVRCFFGGGKNEAMARHDAPTLERIAREELSDLMGLKDEPVVAAVHHWPAANPIYEVGHEARVREIEERLDPALNLYLTGSGFRGIGIPDCVADAKKVAAEVARRT